MKQNIKKISFIVLTMICLITCVSCKKCKKCSDDETNNVIPSISAPDGTFLKLGNYTITNNDAYFQMVNSFGLETLMNIMDKDIIPAATKDEAFTEFLDNIIYPDGEKTEEKRQEFIDKLPLSGLSANPNDENYYEDYYFLRFSRIQHAKKIFKDTKSESYFTETQINNIFNELFSKKEKMIILSFDSSAEARKVLENYSINLNRLNSGWEKPDGTKLTNEEIQSIFEAIFADYHQGNTDAIKEYTYTDLKNINTSLLLDVYYMDENSYTKTIKTYNGISYLVYKVSETANLDESGNEVTLEAKKSVVIDQLIDSTVTTTYATALILSEEIGANLVIYDKGLENTFSLQYEYAISSLGLSSDDYRAFTKSEATSETDVFSYTVNGTTKSISADAFFAKLIKQYGAYLSALYMKQYLILKDNTVLTIDDFQILDQTKYDAYYETDISEYKEKFLADEYSQLGYPSSYGWENFVRDYLGLLSENRILINLDSSLYEECLRLFKENLFLDENETDSIIQSEMEKIAENYFYATTLELRAYYDKDLNGEADELVKDSEEEKLARKLISTVFEKLENETYTSLSTALTDICNSYKISSAYTNNAWKEFKLAGLKLEFVSSKTYTANSTANEITMQQIKLQYEAIMNFKNDPAHPGVNLAGVDLTTYYRNSKLDAPINALNFVDASCSNLIDNAISCYIITKAFDQPYIDESTGTYKPTYEEYKQYYVDSSKQSSGLKNCITNFYLIAIANVITDTDLNNILMDDCLELINNGITYNDVNTLKTYIEACKKSAE